MSELVIETRDLTKKYGDFTAVNALNLSVQRGEVFGLLGPNGAGKTTTILMLLGLTDLSGGSVRVLGFDPTRQPLSVKARVGYMPDMVGFYDDMTARENLIYTAKLNGMARPVAYQRIDEALEQMELADRADKRVGTFSRGMRQRLGVADVLIKHPELIIMDEPTQGLDPESAHEFLQTVLNLKHAGITLLLSSHLLHQVQTVCDRVGLFHQGRMELSGTVPELGRMVLGGAYRVHLEAAGEEGKVESTLKGIPGVAKVTKNGAQGFDVETHEDLRSQIAAAVVNSGASLLGLGIELQSLEAIYTRYYEEVKHGNRS